MVRFGRFSEISPGRVPGAATLVLIRGELVVVGVGDPA